MHSHSLDQWTHDHVFLGEQHAHNERRTWFVVALTAVMMLGEIAAFSSAIILGLIAVQIAYESVVRLVHPVPIAYGEAIAVAMLGLGVNLVSAWLLRDTHDHDHHGHSHSHDHSHGALRHHDNNLRAAYIHVLADAATSVLAIAA